MHSDHISGPSIEYDGARSGAGPQTMRAAAADHGEWFVPLSASARDHGPTSATVRRSGRSRSRMTLLTAPRYARADASTTSVATPRPDAFRSSTSSWITTSPSASPPFVTDDTL